MRIREGSSLIVGSCVCMLLVSVACDSGQSTSDDLFVDPSECPLPNLVRRSAVLGSPVGCGGCDTRCRITTDDPDQADLDAVNAVTALGVVHDGALGGIVIDSSGGTAVEGLYAWVANTWDSTVTKIRLETHIVEGVYRVGLSSQHNPSGGAWDCGNRPSRSAVDAVGDAYIASRGFCGQATVAKFAGDPTRCIDKNGDLDNTDTSGGIADVRGWWGDANEDECLLWQVPVGGSGDVIRALALDGRGRVWVGLEVPEQMVILDPADGMEISRVDMGLRPYGAVESPDGKMWVTSHWDYRIQWVDSTGDTPSNADLGPYFNTPAKAYGIAIDGTGRIFLGEHDAGGLMRYDPALDDWQFTNDPTVSCVGGIAVREDGMIFTADFSNDSITVFDGDSMGVVDSWDLSADGGIAPRGVCIDFDGNIWAANFSTPNVSVVEPGVGVIDTIPVYGNNYTYSDFTGYSLMTYVASAASLLREYHDDSTCLDPMLTAIRSQVYWEADFPDGGELVFYGSSSDDPDAFDNGTVTEVLLGSTTESSGVFDVQGPMTAAGENPSLDYFWLRIEIHRGVDGPVIQRFTLLEYCL